MSALYMWYLQNHEIIIFCNRQALLAYSDLTRKETGLFETGRSRIAEIPLLLTSERTSQTLLSHRDTEIVIQSEG